MVARPDVDVEVLVSVTRTGSVVDSLPWTTYSWKDSVLWSESCPISVDVPFTGHDRAARSQIATLKAIARTAWTFCAVIVRDGRAVAAGPIVAVDWSTTGVTLGSPGITALLDRRMAIADPYYATPNDSRANLKLALPPRDLVLDLIDRGTTGLRRDIPIDIPALTGRTGDVVVYTAADLKTIYEAVKDVTERDGDGPDVRLRPVISEDRAHVGWQVLVGTPLLGSPTSRATLDYPGAIAELSGTSDASESVTTAYVPGNQSSVGGISIRTIGVAVVDPGDPLPALERADRTSVSETRREQLNALASSYAREYGPPAETWTMTLRDDVEPIYGRDYEAGDVVTCGVDTHPWIEPGEYPRRVLSMEGKPGELTMTSVAVDVPVVDVVITDAGGGQLPDDVTDPYPTSPAQPGTGGMDDGSDDDGGTAPDINVPNDLVPMARWYLTLPIADPSGEDDSGPWDVYPANSPDRGSRTPDLLTFSHPLYFYVGRDANGSYIAYVAPVKGVTTSASSGSTRSELRGLAASGAKAGWAMNDGLLHRVGRTITTDPTSVDGRKEGIVLQWHGASGTPPLYAAVNFNDGPTQGKLTIFKNGPSVATLLTGLTPTTLFALDFIKTTTGRVQVRAALGRLATLPTTPQLDWPISDFTESTGIYEKAGAYPKQDIATATTGQFVVHEYEQVLV